MGTLADLSLAQARQENMALRGALSRAEGMIRGMQARERVMEMEQVFIGAALGACVGASLAGGSIPPADSSIVSTAITLGRTTARLYIEALSAEAAADGATEGPKDEGAQRTA